MAGVDIEDLLDLWEESRDRGTPISPEELCRDAPELLDQLIQLVAELQAVDAFLDSTHDTPEPLNFAPTAGMDGNDRYRDERFLAEGGLGRVFVARDAELPREVALKRIQDRMAGSAEGRRRFVLEAEITARLEHPGVVPVYGLCRDRLGQPFYAMRLIRGETMGQAIEQFHAADVPTRDPGERRLALQALLRSFLAACQTIAYAHSRGVIHRDLKPSNLMLGPYGEALVVDWGLAKPIESVEPDDVSWPNLDRAQDATLIGTVKGSPAYMSPEQARGLVNRIGPASDIYSLGATLYTLLTGAKPFQGESLPQVIWAVSQGRFPPPRRVKPAVPRALEAVCLKAMSLDPAQRYPSGSELAHEIERWLSGEAVLAWREPWYDRLRRWARRHRVIVASAAAALLMGVAVLAVTNGTLRDLARRLDASNLSLRAALGEAERNLYARDIDLADRAWWDGQPGRAATLLEECPSDRRGWEWRYLNRRNRVGLATAPLAGPIVALGLAERDRVVTIAAGDASKYGLVGTICHASVSPDGTSVALVLTEASSEVVVADSATGTTTARFKPGAQGIVESLAFSADGRSIAMVVVRREIPPSKEKLSFSTEFEGRLVIHSLATGLDAISPPFRADGQPGTPVASGGGRSYFPVKSGDSTALYALRGRSSTVELVGSSPGTIAVSLDGFWIARSGEANTVVVSELASGRSVATLRGHEGRVRALSFSRDGKRIASAADDRTTRVWETADGRLLTILRGQSSPADHLSFSADGTRLVSASTLDLVVWDPLAAAEATVRRIAEQDHLADLAVLSDGRVAVVAGHRLSWRDPAMGRSRGGEEMSDVTALASAPPGGAMAVGSGEGSIVVVDAEGRVQRTLSGHHAAIQSLSFDRAGLRLASASRDGEVRIWEMGSGHELGRFQAGPVVGLSPDGQSVAWGDSGDVVIQEVTTGVVRQRLVDSGKIRRLVLSPDGKLVAVVRSEGKATPSRDDLTVHEAATGQILYTCRDQPSGVSDVVFSREGDRLVSSDQTGIVLIRESSSGRPLLTLKGPGDTIVRLAFTPDGNRLVAAGGRVAPTGLRDEEAEELTIWDGRPLD